MSESSTKSSRVVHPPEAMERKVLDMGVNVDTVIVLIIDQTPMAVLVVATTTLLRLVES